MDVVTDKGDKNTMRQGTLKFSSQNLIGHYWFYS